MPDDGTDTDPEQEACDDHDRWHPYCDYCRGRSGGTRATDEPTPPYVVEYTVWSTDEGERDVRTFSGVYDEPTPIDCVNAIVYELRGEKSRWELAYVNDISRDTAQDTA